MHILAADEMPVVPRQGVLEPPHGLTFEEGNIPSPCVKAEVKDEGATT